MSQRDQVAKDASGELGELLTASIGENLVTRARAEHSFEKVAPGEVLLSIDDGLMVEVIEAIRDGALGAVHRALRADQDGADARPVDRCDIVFDEAGERAGVGESIEGIEEQDDALPLCDGSIQGCERLGRPWHLHGETGVVVAACASRRSGRR